MQVIRVRDVVRDAVHELGPEEPVLRGPYDLFKPTGSVRKRGELVDWKQGEEDRSARTVSAALGGTHPGERVLVRLPPRAPDEWWLCEVEAVGGVTAER